MDSLARHVLTTSARHRCPVHGEEEDPAAGVIVGWGQEPQALLCVVHGLR